MDPHAVSSASGLLEDRAGRGRATFESLTGSSTVTDGITGFDGDGEVVGAVLLLISLGICRGRSSWGFTKSQEREQAT